MIAQKEKYSIKSTVNKAHWYHRNDRESVLKTVDRDRRTHRKKWESLAFALSTRVHAYSGQTYLNLRVIDQGDPFAETSTSIGGRYGGRARKFCTTDAEHHVTLRKDWFSRVFDQGIMFVDDIFTMDAEKQPCNQRNTKLWKVACLVFVGKKAKVKEYYLAQRGTVSYHGLSVRAALAGLKRKRINSLQHAIRRREASRIIRGRLLRDAAKRESDQAILRQHMDVVVKVQDSLDAGNCRLGTNQFIHAHFQGRNSATVQEIMAVASNNDDAIRACLKAISKHQEKQKENI